MYIAPIQPLHLANAKMVVGRQCAVNETTMACNLLILKPNPTIVYLHTFGGPLKIIVKLFHLIAEKIRKLLKMHNIIWIVMVACSFAAFRGSWAPA